MKRNDLPNKTEWDKIIKDAFDSYDDHVFSEHYEMRKKQMQRRITMKKSTGSRKKVFAVMAASIAAAVLIPTSVYAYSQITAKISKTADYQTTVEISTPAEQVSEETGQYMYYEFGWIPEGYEERDDGKKGFKNYETKGAVYLQFYKLPENESINIEMPYSADCENYESGNKTAMINYSAADNSYYPSYYNDIEPYYDREVFVSFKDTTYLLEMIVTENISHDDLLKMIDSIELVPTDEKLYGDYIPFLDESASQTGNTYEPYIDAVDVNSINACGVGETLSYDSEDVWGGYDITLNSIELTDSFDEIHTDACGWEADYSSIMDENGNIIENIRKTIKIGDGVNSIDEVVSEESIPMHILKVNATFTNTKDETNDIGISPQLFIFKDEKPLVWYEFIYDGDYKIMDSITGLEGSLKFFSLDTAPEKKGGKNSVILEPGESADVQIAFFVPDDLKDEIYLDFVTVGNSLSSSLKSGYPVYDVRQQ